MSDQTELLPCPFCGSTEIKTVVDDGIHFEQCRKCEATGPTGFMRGDEDDASLNTRAAPAEDGRAVVEEPVAWLIEGGKTWADRAYENELQAETGLKSRADGSVMTPLYRHPQHPVVLPERVDPEFFDSIRATGIGWNACIDEFKRLNK